MPDWDAARYHQVSDPQRAWGRRVLDRLAPSANERIVDVGCGSGRLTADLHARVNGAARITGTDRSWTMVSEARRHLPSDVSVVQSDATAMPFEANAFDAVFSTATFHWISDHAILFAETHRVLRPGGRLVAQAGGGKNLETLYTRTTSLSRESDFAEHFIGWRDPWTFAGIDDTVERLERAGLVDPSVTLEPAPTSFPDADRYAEFITTVCLRHHLHRLPESLRAPFVDHLAQQAAADDHPFTLDYWRLNIDARKP